MEDLVEPCRVWWDEEANVARAEWSKGAVCRRDDAQRLDGEVTALGHGRVPVLVDIQQIGSIDRAAREYYMDAAVNYTAIALLAGSPASRMIANFFLGLKRGGNSVKMFTEEADALKWLQAQE
jgi:hypothetical protein